jgi:putative exosortase-associated protein (TIGR04073 family)
MNKAISAMLMLSFVLSPLTVSAQEHTPKPIVLGTEKPVQVLDKGVVNPTLQEPANVDWSTGKGRKDGILKWAVEDNYLQKAPGMFLRGFSNVAFGWVEILTHPVRWSKNAPLGIGTLAGIIVGPVMGTLRTASGAVDIATFWVPFWHGVPMPKAALGLRDVHHYDVIDDVNVYNEQVKRYGFNGLSDKY